MELNILDIAHVLSDVNVCIEYLRGRNLLLQDYFCCGNPCQKVKDPNCSDKQIFQCSSCKRRYSICSRSFFAKSKLELIVLVSLIFFFAKGCTVTETVKLLCGKISKVSTIQWFNYLRDIMTCYFQNNPVIFRNCSVDIDETFIGGKHKYHRGRIPQVTTRYLFGIIERNNPKAFVQFVPHRDFINLIPIITRHVMPGCTINSDGARVYNHLRHMNYIHNVVIHKDNFVTPNGVHTNNIEGFWGNLKMKLKAIRGSQREMLDGHLDKFLYRHNCREEGNIFELLLNDIATFYPI